MNWKVIAIAGACFGLASCDKVASISCDSPDAKNVITSLIADELVKASKAKAGEEDVEDQSLESKVRATVAQLKLDIEDIRTTKSDPDSTKKFCEGSLKVVVPLNMIADADKAAQELEFDLPSKGMETAGFERAADTFRHKITYAVQPTDDRKKTFGEIENYGSMFDAMSQLVSAHIILPAIQARFRTEVDEAKAELDQAAQQTAQQNQADLDLAKAENQLATQAINAVWASLDPETRGSILEIQRAWIKKKAADCNIRAAEASTDPLVKEASRLRCDTESTVARAEDLKAYND
jgi:uncharacterized protein YecT (DUF1311 family)